MSSDSLAAIYESHSHECDKGTVHSYIGLYERLLAPYRRPAVFILEIGVANGSSLLMWSEYFAQGTVFGLDINKCENPYLDKVFLVQADSTNCEQVANFVGSFTGGFDVIIDDGSHELRDQLATYANFRDSLKPNGLYVIEDIFAVDESRHRLEWIDPERQVGIIDCRSVLKRFDDVLVVIRNIPR